MSSQDFAQVVRDALDTNPFLEEAEESSSAESAVADAPAEPVVAGTSEGWGVDGMRASSGAHGDSTVFDTLQARTTLAEHLLGQLAVMRLPERDQLLAAAVIGSLEDDGYLRTPLEEVADASRADPRPDDEEMRVALRHVQSLEPAGVGARSVPECLALQLSTIPCPQARALAATILDDHIDMLAARDVRRLAARLEQPAAPVEAACAAIRRLDPHPGWRFGGPQAQYITPDVIVRKVRGQWTVMLNDAVVPKVRLNEGYVRLLQGHRGAGHADLSAHVQEARWTVRNVEQRFSTILAVAQVILKRQHHFLAYGPMALKPLSLREIADELGMHESTVSRVTNNKYIATPSGVFELKYFFSRGLETASGGECSPKAVRGLIQEIIAAEPQGAPLSDVDLAKELARQGLKVARRTVTKYRQLLRIEPADRRRMQQAAA